MFWPFSNDVFYVADGQRHSNVAQNNNSRINRIQKNTAVFTHRWRKEWLQIKGWNIKSEMISWALTEKGWIPEAISSHTGGWSSEASIHSSGPWTNLLAGSLSILTNESIQAHPLIDVHTAPGRNICTVNSLHVRTVGSILCCSYYFNKVQY